MALADCQWQVRDLILGPGTPWTVVSPSNPFQVSVRADQSGARAWNHGSWSGAEWGNERVVPMRLHGRAAGMAGSIQLVQALNAAFSPVGDAATDVELRFHLGGTEFLLLGRPRLSEPDTRSMALGQVWADCAFVAPDPRIYSGDLHEVVTGLPVQEGGLTVPFTVPYTIPGVLVGGREEVTNAGTTDTALSLRIDGPVFDPRVAVQRPDGDVQSIRFNLDLTDGQWLDVDTAARTALLNGLPEANQRGRAVWDVEPYPLAPGTSVIRFNAGDFNEAAELTVRWRDSWW